ncbi:MAG: transporter substrate-binding protein [Nocardioides sp.]|nr:transporter substrate-binding protein [Nocardioides sp.]
MAAALALLAACLTPGLAVAPARAAGDDTTLTVAVLTDVDSFNPFVGIKATSFEMWALTYDYMIGYSMKDMSPQPGLATSWDTSDDGLTWTFHIRDGVTWSDGEPLTAADIAYTYNRIIDGGPEAATWGSYLTGADSITAPDAETVLLKLKKPLATLPLLPIPIVPEHIWKDVSEKDVKTYKAEPEDGQPVVGSGPFRLVSGEASGSTYEFDANPDYWGGAPHIDHVVFRVYKSEDPAVQGLKKGEVDFVDGITPLQVQALQGEPGITAQNGDSPGFDEIAFNTGAADPETGKPIGDGNPALQDPKFRHALGWGMDLDQLIAKVYQGAGQAGTTIVPPTYSNWRWDPPADELMTYDPDKAGRLLDEAGYLMGDDGLRTMPDGSPIGKLRLFARADSMGDISLNTMDYFKEWLGDLGIDSEVTAMQSNKLTSVILDGDFDAFQWGWYVEPDPNSMLSYMTCGQRGNWSDSWYCNDAYDALYDQQQLELDRDKRIEMVKQMQQMLYEDSPYLVTAYNTIGEAFRSDRFACLVQQPNPGGIWLFQYGVYNYLNMRPADEAGDCGGDAGATKATSAGSDGSVSTEMMIGLGAAAVVVIGAGGILLMRRRATEADRE